MQYDLHDCNERNHVPLQDAGEVILCFVYQQFHCKKDFRKNLSYKNYKREEPDKPTDGKVDSEG